MPQYLSIHALNNSKYVLGFFMVLLNLGSRFIKLKLNDYHEQFLRDTIGKELLIFSICFVGTRDIFVSVVMTSTFVILNDYLFNHESKLCIIPKKYVIKMKSAIDTNNDNIIDDDEIKSAISILNNAKKQRQEQMQRHAYMTFMSNV